MRKFGRRLTFDHALGRCAVAAAAACRCRLLCHHCQPQSPCASQLASGEKLALDELGPLIVTADGSLRRIANWAALSEAERATALRRLGKRNRERVATLQEQQDLLEQQQQHRQAREREQQKQQQAAQRSGEL